MATVLATCHISDADEAGLPVKKDHGSLVPSGKITFHYIGKPVFLSVLDVNSHPPKFSCKIVARNNDVLKMLHEECEE